MKADAANKIRQSAYFDWRITIDALTMDRVHRMFERFYKYNLNLGNMSGVLPLPQSQTRKRDRGTSVDMIGTFDQ